MKLTNYFRQLKKIINSRKNLKKQGIKKRYYYWYNRKIFFSFLLFGLFKDNIQIRFGSDYWKHVPKYFLRSLPNYWIDCILYIFNVLWYNTIKGKHIYFPKPVSPRTPGEKKHRRYIRENVLYNISDSCGFDIIHEHLLPYKTIYTLVLQ